MGSIIPERLPARPAKLFGEAGPSGVSPRRDLPRRRPPFLRTVFANTVRLGARAGEFLLGKDRILMVAHGRVSETGRRGVSEVGGWCDRAVTVGIFWRV